jgi:hypothetical protein
MQKIGEKETEFGTFEFHFDDEYGNIITVRKNETGLKRDLVNKREMVTYINSNVLRFLRMIGRIIYL